MTRGQGHKVKGQGHICIYAFFCFGYKSLAYEWILMILTHMKDNDETFKLTQGQGQKVKGQGHIYVLCKIIVLAINHERIDGS